jgi:acyl carrier protein phosphodiesterase
MISGNWVNYYDELNDMTKSLKCMSSRLNMLRNDLMVFEHANALTDEYIEQLRKEGDPDAD